MKILNIAGLLMKVNGARAEQFVEEVEGMKVFEVEDCHGDESLTIEFDHELDVKRDYVLIHEFLIAEDNALCRLGRRDKQYIVEMEPSDRMLPMFRMEFDGDSCFVATAVENATIFRFAMWMAYGLRGGLCGRTLIHSSTIVYGGKAVMFLGESGTGKSTHTRLWREYIEGARLLNDDSPVLWCTTKGVMVSGSPWSGKTPCYHQAVFPVAGIVRLVQSKENVIKRLDVMHAVAAIQPSLPPSLAYDEFYMGKMWDVISEVVEHVPMYQLRCLPNGDAARLSFKTIIE